MRAERSKIRARLARDFARVALAVALLLYIAIYLVMAPSLRQSAYEALQDAANTRMAAVDQSIRALNNVSVAITYSARVRGYLERLNREGRLANEALRDLTDQLVAINGPMFPAAQIRLYALGGVMVASGMVNGQFAYDPQALPWLSEVQAREGAKVLSLPEADGALVKYSRYVALRRVIKQNYRTPLGVVEVVQDAANLLNGANGGAMETYVFDGAGRLVYPADGALPPDVPAAVPAEGRSGILELDGKLLAWRRSEECDWTLAAIRARREVLAPLYEMTKVTLLALGAVLALALWLSYRAARQFTRPIRALAERMARFRPWEDEEAPNAGALRANLDGVANAAVLRPAAKSVAPPRANLDEEANAAVLRPAAKSAASPRANLDEEANATVLRPAVESVASPRANLDEEANAAALRPAAKSAAPPRANLDELIALGDSFDALLVRLKHSLDAQVLARQQEMQSHMLALQSQMNPHFLYNMLDNLGALVEMEENDRAVEMIAHLSRMLRYIGASGEATVPLREELAHLDDYVECMRLRYGQNLRVDVFLAEGLEDLRVPKLSVQPLVENAVKYGCTTAPPWHIEVRAESVVAGWRLSVRDDGAGIDAHTLKALRDAVAQIRRGAAPAPLRIGGMGLINIAMRLKLTVGDDFFFHMQNLDGGGVGVTIGKGGGEAD